MKLHYAGEIRYAIGGTGVRTMLAGWSACCSGDRAIAIRTNGLNTYDRSKVTCKACLNALTKHDAYAQSRVQPSSSRRAEV